jgi:hypothetical protein
VPAVLARPPIRRPGATASGSPAALALRRLRHEREALVFALLLALMLVALLGAPLYATLVADTTPAENHLTDQVTVDGERVDVVSLDGIPIGPTWAGSTSSAQTRTAGTSWFGSCTGPGPRS